MAHRRQRIKRYRKSLENHARNISNKRAIKTAAANVLIVGREKKSDEAQKILSDIYSKIDKAVKYGVLHKRTAARKKSRITKALQTALQG